MTPLAIARTRPTEDQPAFLMAFTAATQGDRWGIDTEALIRQALADEQYPKVAGLIEGLAAVHAEAGMPTQAAPIDHWRRSRNGHFATAGGAL